jgi:hypothetical protein
LYFYIFILIIKNFNFIRSSHLKFKKNIIIHYRFLGQ